MFCQVMGLKQSLDCMLWLSWLVSTTRGGGIGTRLGCGNVVACNKSTVIVGTINKQVNRMAAGSRLQVQVMDFFFFHFLFKHTLCS